jgi:uncharacterized protein (TIGR02099 family)
MAHAANAAEDKSRQRSMANSGASAGAMQSDRSGDTASDTPIEHARAGVRRAPGGGGSRWLLRLVETLAWTVLLLFAGSVLALRYWVLPHIEEHRAAIVGAFTEGLGLPVQVGAIQADWQGLRPRISLSNVRVYDPEGREALVLPAVHTVLSWRSLMVAQLRMRSLVIDSPRLSVRRDSAGRLYVAGLELFAGRSVADQGGGAAAWILGQREIQVHNAEIEWVDDQRSALPLKLSALNLRLRSAGGVHQLGLSARPPEGFGTSLVLRAELTGGQVNVPSTWSGRLYAEFGDTDLAAWQPWVDYPLELSQGRGALRMWVTLGAGQRVRTTLDVKLSGVSARLAPDLPRLDLANLEGRLEGRAEGGSFELNAHDLALTLADGEALEPTSFRVGWAPEVEGKAERPAHGELSALRIDLAPLARIAEFLPFPADLRALLGELSPRGRLRQVSFSWTGTLPRATDYRAQARFEDLGMKAWHAVPGFSGMTGEIEARSGHGHVELRARNAGLDLPRVFPQPHIALAALSGAIDWEQPAPDRLRVRLSSLAFGNAHLAGTAFGTYELGSDGPGQIDLSAALTHAEGKRMASYLPLASIMGTNTRAWIERAIVDGRFTDVRFHLKGDLREFPFADPTRGELVAVAHVDGGVLDYADGWPRIEGVDGTLRLDRERIEISGQSAHILGVQLANVRVAIPSVTSQTPEVLIEGEARGPTNAFLKFIETSPVRRMTQGFTVGMRAEGDGQLQLALKLPLTEMDKSSVSGLFGFSAKRLMVSNDLPPLEAVNAKFAFSEGGLRLEAFRGTLFGGPLAITGGTQRAGALRLSAKGEARMDALRPLIGHPWFDQVTGVAAYEAELSALRGHSTLRLTSDLKGVESTLPAPATKRPDDALPLSLSLQSYQGTNWRHASISLGTLARAELLRAAPQEDASEPRTKNGGGNDKAEKNDATAAATRDAPRGASALVVLNPAPDAQLELPAREGLTLRGKLDALDLDAWRALPGSGEASGVAKIDLDVGTLDLFSRRLHRVDVRAGTDAGGWSAEVSAAELEGNLAYRSEGAGLLVARLKRFRIPENSPGRDPLAAADAGERRAVLPAVDLLAERFELWGRELGRAEIGARPVPGAWEIDKLIVLNPHGELRGKGTRMLKDGVPRTSLAFQLNVTDVGKFLARVGYPDMVAGGHARLDGELAWNGEPQRIDYPSLAGDFKLHVDDGQFLEIDPGLGKLVGLISLQELPKRIQLDYRDVFSAGFKFDRIEGSIKTQHGVMSTDDFSMHGPSAEVDMRGTTDLAAETQNLHVKIVPSVSDTASAVAALLNPIAGGVALLAQHALQNPLGQMLSYEYAITGTWSDPQIKKVAPEVKPGGGAHVEAP